VAGHCVLAWGRDYRISIDYANGIPTQSSGGDAWDWPGGLPDPFVVLALGEGRCETPCANDTLEPFWGHDCGTVRINQSTTFAWTMYDMDISDHDAMFSTEYWTMPVGFLKDEGWVATGDGLSVYFSVTPE